jgi:hypothetical protein
MQTLDVTPIIWRPGRAAIESPFDKSGVGGMYLRFVTTRVHKNSHKPEGVFAAAYALLDSGDLARDEWRALREMLNWFSANLKSQPKTFDARRAIFWFKSNAEENKIPEGGEDECYRDVTTFGLPLGVSRFLIWRLQIRNERQCRSILAHCFAWR